jgi:hypothetical protein
MTKEDGTPEDFCAVCRFKSSSEYSILDHSYEHEMVTEGFSESSRKGYYYDWTD